MEKPQNRISNDAKGGLKAFLKKTGFMSGVIIGAAVAVCSLIVYIQSTAVYNVKVGQASIGYVKSLETYKKAIEAIKLTDGDVPLKMVTVEKTYDKNTTMLSSSDVEKATRQRLNLKMPAVVLYADGVEIGKLFEKEDVDKALDMVKKEYIPEYKGAEITITASSIKEEITTASLLAEPEEVMSAQDIAQKILNGRGEHKTYTVKEKDTIWGIAIKNSVSISEIETANPDVNIERIRPGQEIKLAVSVPYLNVQVTANVKAKEEIPHSTRNVVDKSKYRGTKRVTQRGKDGLEAVEKQITVVNGEIVDENVINTTVLVEAVEEVVAVGGKVRQYVATGDFMYPTRGHITSRFGRRWGKMHEGLDIAVPTGTPIHAADSGRVSFAGWYSSYGKCVIIDHKNGYQTLYGHNSKLYVTAGQSVNKGTVIAASGSTGRSTGPHCHFEVRKNGVPQNPLRYLD